MQKNKGRILSILLIALSIILIGSNVNAHSGRTDASGGHRDNKNKSGLGSYHYHCGGNPAHLHTNGVCPYSPSSSSSKSGTSGSTSSNRTTNNIEVTKIRINEEIEKIEVGKSESLTVTIIPSNATNKKITWKSNNEEIATVSATGKVTAKKPGIVKITATSSNGKTSVTEINIEEQPKVESNNIINTSTLSKNDPSNTNKKDNQEGSNPLAAVISLGILGGGGYFVYKQYKKGEK